jgi:hypothetical protein
MVVLADVRSVMNVPGSAPVHLCVCIRVRVSVVVRVREEGSEWCI